VHGRHHHAGGHNPKLALWVLAVVPVVVAPIIIFGRRCGRSRARPARVADMVSEGGETLDAVRTVQAFAQEMRAAESFGQATERAFGAAISRISRRAIMTTLVIFIVFAAVGFLLWMGGHDVITGTISGRRPLAFVFYAVLVATSAARSAKPSATCSAPRVPPSGWPNCARSAYHHRGRQPQIAAQASPGRRRLRRGVLQLSDTARLARPRPL